MGLRQVNHPWLTDVVPTTDATPTVSSACSYIVPSGAFGYVDINVVVNGASTTATTTVRVPFRNVAGTLTLLTKVIALALSGDAGLLTVIIDATSSGTTIQPRVTGIALTTLSTQLDCRYSVQ